MNTGDDAEASDTAAPRRLAEPVAVWVLFGLFLGGAAPGMVIPGLRLEPTFLLFLPGSILVGFVGGVALGALDPPRWGRPGGGWWGLIAALGASLAIAPVWSGASGAAGALSLFGTIWAFSQGSMNPNGIWEMAMLGALLGAAVGSPIVWLFAAVRFVGFRVGRPFWVSAVAAALLPSLGGGLGILVFDSLFGAAL